MWTLAEGPRSRSRHSLRETLFSRTFCVRILPPMLTMRENAPHSPLCSQPATLSDSPTVQNPPTPPNPRWALEPMAAAGKELPKVASQRGGGGAHLVRRGTQSAGAGSRHLCCGPPAPRAHLGRTVALERGVACVDSAPGITFPGRRRSPAEPGVLATLAGGLDHDVPVPSLLGWASGWEQRVQTRSTWKPVVFCPPQFSLPLRERDLFLPKFNIH